MPNTFISSGFSGHVRLQYIEIRISRRHDWSFWFRKQKNGKNWITPINGNEPIQAKCVQTDILRTCFDLRLRTRAIYSHLHHKLHLSLECSIEHNEILLLSIRYEWILFYSVPFGLRFSEEEKKHWRLISRVGWTWIWQTQRNWDGLLNCIQLEINVTWRACQHIERYLWLNRSMKWLNWTKFNIKHLFVIFNFFQLSFQFVFRISLIFFGFV